MHCDCWNESLSNFWDIVCLYLHISSLVHIWNAGCAKLWRDMSACLHYTPVSVGMCDKRYIIKTSMQLNSHSNGIYSAVCKHIVLSFRYFDHNYCLKGRATELAGTPSQVMCAFRLWGLQYLWGKFSQLLRVKIYSYLTIYLYLYDIYLKK